MDRREMLEESTRRVARALPKMLGLLGGLGQVLPHHDEDKPPADAACFPTAPRDAPTDAHAPGQSR